ncbi:TlpA family protein disulfide reductase [Thiolapillus sp.]
MGIKHFALLAAIGIGLGAVIAGVYQWRQQHHEVLPDSHGVYSQIPDFTLPNLDGNPWRAEEWRDKILVLNFWATWCPPCRKEMPMFVRLQNEFADKDVLFVGIAIDDKQAVQDFVDTYGIEFPILHGEDRAMALSTQLGDRFNALPYTVVADRGGKILLRQAGEMLESRLRPLLEELTQTP